MNAEINIYGPIAKLSGEFPMAAVREATSYAVEGAQFSPMYRKGLWDGRKHLLKPASGAFPTGLVDLVTHVLDVAGVTYQVTDHRRPPAPQGRTYDLLGVTMDGKYDYQLEAAEKAVAMRQGVLRIATNGGKCLAPNTGVRLFNGQVKKAKEIVVGDQLMGPDSLPRTVKSTCVGTGEMYRINPTRGESWECNDVHILTLRNTETDQLIDIPLNEYLTKSDYFKHCHKQLSAGVEYPQAELPVIPYFIGLWLGDGTKALKTVAVTTADDEIYETLRSVAQTWGCYLNEDDHPNNASSTYHFSTPHGKKNPLLSAMRALFVIDNIRIPEAYMISSRDQRLQLLAGLIDSDGHASDGRYYEITQVRKELANDIRLLARSLGFGATLTPKEVAGTVYWRVNILGATIDEIPVCLARKRLTQERKKHPNSTSFTVEPLGVGDYAGFTLDGDGRFLLEDYTITHNTEIACAITQYLKLPTIFMVTTRELLYQARDRFMKRLGATEAEVGLVGDGHWEPGSWVTIATVDTVESRFETQACQDLLKNCDVLFVDECHHAGSETWYDVCTSCPANYRYGLSGTPMDRTDGANLRLLAAIGPIIVDIGNKFLVERGISAKTDIIFSRVTAPVLPKRLAYPSAYKQGVVENPHHLALVVDWVKVFMEAGLSTLVLCEEIAHGKSIDKALWTDTGGVFIPHLFIYGDEKTDVRASALKDFADRKLPVLVASTILDEGVDVPAIDALIVAGSRKSRIKTMQRLGRGLRGSKLLCVEFANFTNDHLLRHSLTRLEDYKKEDCFPIYQSPPDLALVQRLWNSDK